MINIERANKAFFNTSDALSIANVPETINVPILMVSGWYDVFFGGQMADWERLRRPAVVAGSFWVLGHMRALLVKHLRLKMLKADCFSGKRCCPGLRII